MVLRLSTLDHHFGGNKISQSWNDLFIWEQVLNNLPPARILELGTFTGGMAVFLHVQAILRGADFQTYDNRPLEEIRCERFDSVFPSVWQIPFNHLDIQAPAGIEIVTTLIQKPGRTILFCDNGNKEAEADIYASQLKEGDVLAVHDWGTECKRVPDILTLYTPIEGIYEELESMTRFFTR